ncbi:MAG TPA: DUF167 domain-containing protein [Bryobacteraceae bacterium]
MLLRIKVKPGSKKPRIEEDAAGAFTIHLKSPPVDGKANEELIAVLAAHFRVPKSRVRIKNGLVARSKLVEIL